MESHNTPNSGSAIQTSGIRMVHTITAAPDPNVLTATSIRTPTSVIHEQHNSSSALQKNTSIPSFVPSSVGVQKIAALPSLAAGLMSPAAVAKAALVSKQANICTSTPPLSAPLQQSNIAQQLSLLNSSQANTNILIKTTKTNVSGQPTYVAISIPAHSSTSTGQRQVIPLAIHQLKLKQESLSGGGSDNRSSVPVSVTSMTPSTMVHNSIKADPQGKNLGVVLQKLNSVGSGGENILYCLRKGLRKGF